MTYLPEFKWEIPSHPTLLFITEHLTVWTNFKIGVLKHSDTESCSIRRIVLSERIIYLVPNIGSSIRRMTKDYTMNLKRFKYHCVSYPCFLFKGPFECSFPSCSLP